MKRGRPKLRADDETVQTTIRLPAKQFDAIQREAADRRQTSADWIRHTLAQRILQSKNRQ